MTFPCAVRIEMKYCVCQNGNRISVKRGDRDYDFGMVLCRCDTYEEAKNSALYFRMAKGNGGDLSPRCPPVRDGTRTADGMF